MKDDETGFKIPFCPDTFTLKVEEGTEDLLQYITMTVTDKERENPELGQLRLKMQTMINGGKPLKTSNVKPKEFVKQIEKNKAEWYPLFSDLNESPGQLLIESKFVINESWK